ncbi:2OG-Fe dioxygenase family protein [Mycobacterium ostraviense]|uniref:2OG-Fe dioxygenase family protein n=1 Tax=Mycobacterium ostraviense TaxID=2738409 RepID=A0A162CY66_9MYCO|nr:2OG-Fe dioxygenase family protein [Mycobacterium ostraviense]KZS62145.1 hypothetical protein A4G28_18820 [Mycobacterium ostraviense]UGT94474.1 2OG-Fe dioxygenase family protein [Mycobacterium ostraviense]
MSPLNLTRSLGVGREAWTRFARHWDDLAQDPYAAELGVRRLRRYGHYLWRDRAWRLLPNGAFAQPDNSNPLYVGKNRDFEPLTDAFAQDPLLHALMRLLGRVATGLDDAAEWHVKVHPFRVQAVADGDGRPAPEGPHRDGVTLVSSLMVRRRNTVGGQSSVCDLSGRPLLTTTLDEPGTLLLGDDRRTLHDVSPIRPIDHSELAQRDVLVITFAAADVTSHR